MTKETYTTDPKKNQQTREILIRSGTAILTEQGFTATGIDGILKQVKVPKGSFYYYFASKEAFGLAILDYYSQYFARKLDRCLLDTSLSPLKRIYAFYQDAAVGMEKYQFKRGCLVGNLGQEITLLPASFRMVLITILKDWQQRIANCLKEAQQHGELSTDADCETLAEYFWIGWEGAVMRARLVQTTQPLKCFIDIFMKSLPTL